MLGPLHQNQHFLEGPTPPLSKRFFPPYRQNCRLSTQQTFFSDSLEEFALLLGQCAALRSLAQLTTPFLDSGKAPKWVFFHLIDKIADFLHNKLFFLIAPRDLHHYWQSAQPCAVNNTFFTLWECPKMGFFP